MLTLGHSRLKYKSIYDYEMSKALMPQLKIEFGEYKAQGNFFLSYHTAYDNYLFIIAQLAMYLTHSLVMQSSDTTQRTNITSLMTLTAHA